MRRVNSRRNARTFAVVPVSALSLMSSGVFAFAPPVSGMLPPEICEKFTPSALANNLNDPAPREALPGPSCESRSAMLLRLTGAAVCHSRKSTAPTAPPS